MWPCSITSHSYDHNYIISQAWALQWIWIILLLIAVSHEYPYIVTNHKVMKPIGVVGISTRRQNGVYAFAAFLLFMVVFRLTLEVIQMWSNFSAYVKSWINYMEMVLYLTSTVFVCVWWVFHFDCLCPTTWQWQLGVVAVYLGWANLIVFVSDIPFIGIYVLMFRHILLTFLKVLIFSILLIVTFGLTFYFTSGGCRIS